MRVDQLFSVAAVALLAMGGTPVLADPTPAAAPTARAKAATSSTAPAVPRVRTGQAVPKAPPPAATPVTTSPDAPPAVPLPPPPVEPWSLADARALLAYVQTIDSEGLFPADYEPAALRQAIAQGPGPALDEAATRSFTWLAEDLRDGRTPMTARKQWFVVDTDTDRFKTDALLHTALQTHDIPGVLTGLLPTHPDYAVLKAALAATPKTDKGARAKIQINLDRWRWLPRDLGNQYLITNIPEYMLRLTVNDKIVRTYRTVVGKPGKTATPQLAEVVKGVIFNPTWTVPQSIVVGEGLGARLLAHPKPGYKATKNADGTITVVQQPGPENSLGLVKLDMPNPQAIFLHDTPSRQLFNAPVRAFSHGCVRTERALELGITLAILLNGTKPEDAAAISTSGKYTRVPIQKHLPIYITYFTMAQDVNGKLSSFEDIYDRDPPVLASFAQPRQLKTTQRTTNEAIIPLEDGGI